MSHLGEQLTLNQWVLGSSPRWCTKKIPRKKLRGIFYCYFPEKQELGAPSGARRARVFQAVKKTFVGASIARPCSFVCETTSPENVLLRQGCGRPMVAPTEEEVKTGGGERYTETPQLYCRGERLC